MKMVDVGYTYPKSDVATPVNGEKAKKQYPSFTVRDKKEMFEKCEVGKDYTITAKVKCTRKESNEREGSQGGQSFDFEIQSMGIDGMGKGKSEMSDKELNDEVNEKTKGADDGY